MNASAATSHDERRCAGGAVLACRRAADLGLGATLAVAPFFFGGRHDAGRFVFVLFVGLAAIAWRLRQQALGISASRPAHGQTLLLVAALLAVGQLTPLPTAWLTTLAPHLPDLLPYWFDAATPSTWGRWTTLSLTPAETRLGLALVAAYALLTVTVVQRLERLADVEKLLRVLGLASGLMAVFGIVQFACSNGKFFWFYQHPYRSPTWALTGAFANRNHFAHFLALGAAPLACWLLSAVASEPRRPRGWGAAGRLGPHAAPRQATAVAWCVGALLAAVLYAIVRSGSRGGAAAVAASAATFGAFAVRAGAFRGRRGFALGVAAVATVALVSAFGYDAVARRFDTVVSGSLEDLDEGGGRRKIWAANVDAAATSRWFGFGVGAHRSIYPAFLPDPPAVEYTHADSSYLQIATETGLLGACLAAATIVVVLRLIWTAATRLQDPRSLQLAGACAGGIAASLLHAAVDFVWYLPSCLGAALTLIACLLRIVQLERPAESRPSPACAAPPARWAELAIGGGTAAVCLWASLAYFGPARAAAHWDRYLTLSRSERLFEEAYWNAAQRDDAVADAKRIAATQAMLESLRAVVQRHPDHARAHLQLANRYCQLFELLQARSDNAMPVSQIRAAAVASEFADAAALRQWLGTAFGDRHELLYRAYAHAYRAVRLDPLAGEAYLTLAELAFLQPNAADRTDALLAQAERVRPYDGRVLFHTGRHMLLEGRLDDCLERWRRAYRQAGPHQLQIAAVLAQHVPAEAFLEWFAPQWDTLPAVFRHYASLSDPAAAANVLTYAQDMAASSAEAAPDAEAAAIWRALATMQETMGATDAALDSLNSAVATQPDDYALRRDLGLALVAAGRLAEADEHLHWCLFRNPSDTSVQFAAKQAARRAPTPAAAAARPVDRPFH